MTNVYENDEGLMTKCKRALSIANRPFVIRASSFHIRGNLGASATRINQAGSPRGKPAFLVVVQGQRQTVLRPGKNYFLLLRPDFLSDRAGFFADFFSERLATRFLAFFGERVVFLVVFFFAAISLAPRTSAHVRCAKLFPSGGSYRGSRRKHSVGDYGSRAAAVESIQPCRNTRRAAFYDRATAPTARIEASFGETSQDEFALRTKIESVNFGGAAIANDAECFPREAQSHNRRRRAMQMSPAIAPIKAETVDAGSGTAANGPLDSARGGPLDAATLGASKVWFKASSTAADTMALGANAGSNVESPIPLSTTDSSGPPAESLASIVTKPGFFDTPPITSALCTM
jgi:hypothetical protein